MISAVKNDPFLPQPQPPHAVSAGELCSIALQTAKCSSEMKEANRKYPLSVQ